MLRHICNFPNKYMSTISIYLLKSKQLESGAWSQVLGKVSVRKATLSGQRYLTWELDKSESAGSAGVEGWQGGEGAGSAGPVGPGECTEGTVQTWVLKLQPAGRIQPGYTFVNKVLLCYFC